jgi:hypothetical protein
MEDRQARLSDMRASERGMKGYEEKMKEGRGSGTCNVEKAARAEDQRQT